MKKQQTLAEYVYGCMTAHKPPLTAKDVQDRARAQGESISDSTINNILTEAAAEMRVSTIKALAEGLGRPLTEVVAVVFGYPIGETELKKGMLGTWWSLYEDLPTEEDQKFFSRWMETMIKEMQAATYKTKKRKS